MHRRRWWAALGGVALGLVALLSVAAAVDTQLNQSSNAEHHVTYVVLNPANGRASVPGPGITSGATVILNPTTGQVLSISR
jgi:cell division protein FtsI/penicillin-binding protein 2